MQVIDTRISRSQNQSGMTVEFLGDGGDTVSLHLRGENAGMLSDKDVIQRAKAVLIQIASFEEGSESTSNQPSSDMGTNQTLNQP